jgi:glycosyltransferase involved in cell wall biosynthesis
MTPGRPLHVAVWCPMPPAPSGVAEYGFRLVEALAAHVSVSVVVPSSEVDRARAPEGVPVLSGDEPLVGLLGQPDVHLYHVGNHPQFHGWMLAAIAARPGIVVLHDLSLLDLYRGVCASSPFLWDRVLAGQGYDRELSHTVVVDGEPTADRLFYTFTGDVVRQSLCTIVHSRWGADQIAAAVPGAPVVHIPLATSILEAPQPEDTGAERRGATQAGTTVAVLGGINHHKRVGIAVRAFAQAARGHPHARLLVVGRADDEEAVANLRERIRHLGLEGQAEVRLDVSNEEFERVLQEAVVVVALRWPTAGETSAVIVQALGAGRAVVTSDVPQFAEYDRRYVHLVPAERPDEVDNVAAILAEALAHPDAFRAAGAQAREDVRAEATWERVAAAYVHVLDEYGRRPGRTDGAHRLPGEPTVGGEPTGIPGLTVHGDWAATTGLAHAARRLCVGLLSQGVPLAVDSVASHAPTDSSLVPPELAHPTRGQRYPLDLWTLNLNEFHLVPDGALRSPRTRRYHIATWYWELPDVPPSLVGQFDRIDELWVPSQFVRRAFVGHTDRPLIVVPTTVPTFVASDERSVLRDRFGLPKDAVVFLFTFDFNSTASRKNPMGVVEAFTRAFPERGPGSPVLVIKAINLERAPSFETLLTDAVEHAGGVLFNSLFSGQEMADLFHACDVYVSLHRSEGFGLGMAEAMAIGKPVIATGYSGNLDFMNVANSCLVGYRLRPIVPDDHTHNVGIAAVYTEGALWAEPDIGQAARWMRALVADPQLRYRFGEHGRQTIAALFTEEAVGRIAVDRLRTLADELHLREPSPPSCPAGARSPGDA